jgi:hypothetical protein
MLEQKLPDEKTLRDHILELMYTYFDEAQPAVRLPASLRDNWGEEAPQLIDLFWGLVAATHDIATPLQSFQTWCRDFLIKYFGDRAVASFDILPVLLDVFHHPRFPFYKSAITNHYGWQERNWLESIFHLGLSSRIDHALAGSLVLMRGIEPDDAYSGNGIWRKVTYDLEKLSEGDRPELGLVVPAYISHAIAFSHLGDMRWRWEREQGEKENKERRDVPLEPRYFATTAANFKVLFKKFPLTYLIALCEVLLDCNEEEWMGQLMPKVQVRPDQFSSRTVSSFYVRGVEVELGALILDLCLWENDLRSEGGLILSRDELTGLINDFKYESEFIWVVYDAALYVTEKSSWKKVITHPHDWWCDVEVNGGKERRLSRPVYNILMLSLRLREFQKLYICDTVKFGVRFENVRARDGSGDGDLVVLGS